MKRNPIAILFIFFVLFSVDAAADTTAFSGIINKLDTIADTFKNTVLQPAKYVFFTFMAIDLALLAIPMIFSGTPDQALKTLVMRVFFYGFVFQLMISDWLALVCTSFLKLGGGAASMPTLNPADLMAEGINVVSAMLHQFDGTGGMSFSALSHPFAAITMALCIIITLFAFTILTAQFVAVLLQMKVYAALAPLLLAFGGLKFTRDVSLRTMSAAISIGLKGLMIYFVVAVAKALIPLMGADIQVTAWNNMTPMFSAVSMSIVLAFLAIKGPALATDILSGSSSISGGDVFGAAGAASGAVSGVAGFAAGAAVGAANAPGVSSVMEAVKTYSSAAAGATQSFLSGGNAQPVSAAASSSGVASAGLSPVIDRSGSVSSSTGGNGERGTFSASNSNADKKPEANHRNASAPDLKNIDTHNGASVHIGQDYE